MQENQIVRIHLEPQTEDRYTSIQLTETATADDLCRFAVQKLVGNVRVYVEHGRQGVCLVPQDEKRGNEAERAKIRRKAASPSLELRFYIQHLRVPSDSPPAPLPAYSLATPLKEGPLKLRGKRRFKDRYFILTSSHILYTQSQKTISQLSAVISLEDVTVCVRGMQPVNENTFGKFSFELITHEKIFIVKAESAEERGKWMKAISEQIGALLDGKAFRRINAQIRTVELSRSERNITLIDHCSDFDPLLSRPESRSPYLETFSSAS